MVWVSEDGLRFVSVVMYGHSVYRGHRRSNNILCLNDSLESFPFTVYGIFIPHSALSGKEAFW